jgi:hypothetical protein
VKAGSLVKGEGGVKSVKGSTGLYFAQCPWIFRAFALHIALFPGLPLYAWPGRGDSRGVQIVEACD